MFKLDEFHKTEEEKKKLFLEYVSEHVRKRLVDPLPINEEEWSNFLCNSYEQKLLHKKLDNSAFLSMLKYYISQSRLEKLPNWELASSYDDAIIREHFPNLIKRFEDLINKYNGLEREFSTTKHMVEKLIRRIELEMIDTNESFLKGEKQ